MSEDPPFDLPAYLEAERDQVNRALERAVTRLQTALPEPLPPAASHAVLSGGKRLRPILCVAAQRACGGGVVDASYDMAAALEFIHAYSLMHDDLPCMDDADLRRGRPTPHKIFGEIPSMQAGAALIPAAALQAWWAAGELGCSPERGAAVVAELMRAAGAGGMVGGQVLDLVGEGQALNAVRLDSLHRMKTGALLRAALRVGGLAVGADGQSLDALGRYGRAVGLAFQIADDILDATSDAESLGKNPSDASLDKSTYVSRYGLDEAKNRATAQVTVAKAALAEAGIDSPALTSLADFIVERKH